MYFNHIHPLLVTSFLIAVLKILRFLSEIVIEPGVSNQWPADYMCPHNIYKCG